MSDGDVGKIDDVISATGLHIRLKPVQRQVWDQVGQLHRLGQVYSASAVCNWTGAAS